MQIEFEYIFLYSFILFINIRDCLSGWEKYLNLTSPSERKNCMTLLRRSRRDSKAMCK